MNRIYSHNSVPDVLSTKFTPVGMKWLNNSFRVFFLYDYTTKLLTKGFYAYCCELHTLLLQYVLLSVCLMHLKHGIKNVKP